MKHDFKYGISIEMINQQYSYTDYVQMIDNCFLIHLQILAFFSQKLCKASVFSHLRAPYIDSLSHAIRCIACKYSNFLTQKKTTTDKCVFQII